MHTGYLAVLQWCVLHFWTLLETTLKERHTDLNSPQDFWDSWSHADSLLEWNEKAEKDVLCEI